MCAVTNWRGGSRGRGTEERMGNISRKTKQTKLVRYYIREPPREVTSPEQQKVR
jgi:hypothetical protein